jgi:hypothetical protein
MVWTESVCRNRSLIPSAKGTKGPSSQGPFWRHGESGAHGDTAVALTLPGMELTKVSELSAT